MQHVKKFFLIAVGLAVAVLFLFFAMVNREVVTIDLTPFPYTLEIRLFLFAAGLVLIGVLLGWVVASFECRRRYLVQKDTKRRLQALEEEVRALRQHQQHVVVAQASSPPLQRS